jgi:hypothetical protein
VVWSTPSPWPCGRRCPPSALYTFPGSCEPGLGSALARMHRHPGRSPNLTGVTFGVSPEGLKFASSPLCLPVSPLGHESGSSYATARSLHCDLHA